MSRSYRRHLMKTPSNLYLLRIRSGFSQREIASLLYVAGSTLSELESGRKDPTSALFFAAGIVFGVDPSELFPPFCERIESRLMRLASKMFDLLEGREDQASKDKCRQLL